MATAVPPDYVEGDGPTLDDMNAILANLRELWQAIDRATRELHYAITPASGIAVGGSADCIMCGRNPFTGAMIQSTKSVKVWNHPGAGAIEGGVYVVIGRVSNNWTVLLEPCPASAQSTSVPTPPSNTVGVGTSTGTGGGPRISTFVAAGSLNTRGRIAGTGTGTGSGGGGLTGTGAGGL